MNVLCISAINKGITADIWTQYGQYNKARDYFTSLPVNTVIVSFAAEAEASTLISMGIDPLKFKWIDLQLEAKMLYNHNDVLAIGKHIQEGREITIRTTFNQWGKPLPKKVPSNLASVLLRFLNIRINTEHKDKMREIILSKDDKLIQANALQIMSYCSSDTRYLPQLLEKILFWQRKCIPPQYLKNIVEEMFLRGEYSVRTAMMVREGLPINVGWAHNLATNVPVALDECIRDINSQFDFKPFRFDKKKASYVMDTKVIKSWIREQGFKEWVPTDKGGLSLSLEAWEKYFNYRHEFPRWNLGAQMVRYLKLKQSLSSFNITDEDKSFFNTVGTDGRSRPYFNHYGAQSSRSQPKSSGFLFLKGAWTRVLAQPPEGYVIGAIDYSSQEFLIGGLQANDRKMIDAYASGDVYLAYGKEINVIPKDGTKSSHGKERDAQKPVILGWQYWSTGYSLSYELTNQTGRKWTPEEAQPLLDRLDRTYARFAAFRNETVDRYQVGGYLRLPDGWAMFGNNPSFRSSANFMTQGMGAVIMRKAVALAQDRGLTVIQTLHDALYIMSKQENFADDMDLLGQCMREAFIFYFENKQDASLIRVDMKAWGPGFEDKDYEIISKMKNKIAVSKYHIDKRSLKEYSQFSKFFLGNPGIELL